MAQNNLPDATTVVLIAAAATAVLGRNVKVKRIRLIQKRPRAWEDMGRFSIHTSHFIWKNN
ncbi:MAG: hypothetical protein WCI73_13115 [Phycisphaerae bacterium]